MKIAMILASEDFRDEEYFTSRRIFDEVGAEVKVVSDKQGVAHGADGGNVSVDIKLNDLNVADFDAIVFIGGPGTLRFLDNEQSYKVAKEAVEQGKLLAAICISPVILAKAGLLQGKEATVWSSILDKSAADILEEHGAVCDTEDVIQDDNIITANGPEAAERFANAIIEALTK